MGMLTNHQIVVEGSQYLVEVEVEGSQYLVEVEVNVYC
jgi:hypothetical protein